MTKDFPPQPGDAFVLRQNCSDQQWNPRIQHILVVAVTDAKFPIGKTVHIITTWREENTRTFCYSISGWNILRDSLIKL